VFVVVRKMQTRLMSSQGIRLAIGSLALCFASSAGAQGSLEQGKTAAQLYAANCASCHKSPRSVTKATGIFGLESFLRGHYTPSSQSAATIAAYLNGLERQSSGSVRARGSKHTSQANTPKPSPSKTKEDKSPVARALNSAADTAERILNRLLQAKKREND
jgi:cytochrome c